MKLKTKLLAVWLTLTGTIGNALAAANNTFNPDLDKGHQNLMSLQYADKAQWILDTLYAVIDLAAKLAILVLIIKILFTGWDSVEAELRGRKAFIMIIIIILGLKIGLMIINVVLNW